MSKTNMYDSNIEDVQITNLAQDENGIHTNNIFVNFCLHFYIDKLRMSTKCKDSSHHSEMKKASN